jgi:hypothetical protein
MQDPDASYRPEVNLNFEDKYRARLEELEERESTVATARPGSTYLAYKFSLHEMDGTPVLDDVSGDPYLQWHTCSNQTGYSKPPYIGSREIAEALLKRKLDSDDVRSLIDQGWDRPLIGKTALVDLQMFKDEKTGNERIRIVRILPDRKVAADVPPARGHGQAPATNGTDETNEEKRARLRREMEALEQADV